MAGGGNTEANTRDTERALHMTDYAKGTVLTCGHGGCGCRVLVEQECHCAEGSQAYRCTCGAELVAVE